MGRVAARRGDFALARREADAARRVLDRGTNEDQRPYLPYLTGYIEFYAGDFDRAIEELSRGDLDDPFVAGLLAQAYERQGDRAQAREFYQRVMASPSHSINAAFARPLARTFLDGG